MIKAILIIITGFLLFCFIFWRVIKVECSICPCIQAKKITPTYTVLVVCNNEDCIEGVIYSLIKETRSKELQNILVVDVNSNDDTSLILDKLSKRYEFIHIIHSNSYIDMVSN